MRLGRRALLATPALLAAQAAQAAPLPILNVGDQKGGVEALLKAAGLLEGAPVRLVFSQFGAAAPLLEALNAGAVDVAAVGDAPATFALASGVRARIVAATRGTGASTAVVVPDGSAIRTPSDLRGKLIATNRGSIGHALLLALAQREGWDAKDVQIANLLPADARAALRSGAVAGWSTWNSYVAQARLDDGARVVVDGRAGLLTGLSYQVASGTAIASRREALGLFLGLVVRGRRWALDNADRYARALAAEIGISQAVARLAFDTDLPHAVPLDDSVIASEQQTIDLLARSQLIRERLQAGPLFDRSFSDGSAY